MGETARAGVTNAEQPPLLQGVSHWGRLHSARQEAGTDLDGPRGPSQLPNLLWGCVGTEQRPAPGKRGLGQRRALTEAAKATTGEVPAEAQAPRTPVSRQRLSLAKKTWRAARVPGPGERALRASATDTATYSLWVGPPLPGQAPASWQNLGGTGRLSGHHQGPGGCKYSSR